MINFNFQEPRGFPGLFCLENNLISKPRSPKIVRQFALKEKYNPGIQLSREGGLRMYFWINTGRFDMNL